MTISKFTNQVSGSIELEPSDSTLWRGPIVVNGQPVSCGLYIDADVAADPAALRSAAVLLDDLSALDRAARAAFVHEYSDNQLDHPSVVAGYLEMHLKELGDEFVAHVFGTRADEVTSEMFFSKLVLHSLAVHRQGASAFAVHLDYVLDNEQSDELLVAKFDGTGCFLGVAHES